MEPRSASGLFKAISGGKVAKPVERIPQDFYSTPAEVTQALLMAERDRLMDFDPIWEPAAGDGAMVKVLKDAGFMVVASDITDRGCPHVNVKDFFDYTTPPARAIITNPPFSKVNWRDGRGKWITHASIVLEIEYMALLLPWAWPAASGLGEVWEVCPPAVIYLLTWRIDFTGQAAPPSSHAWFVWDAGHRGETIFRRLDRPGRQGRLL